VPIPIEVKINQRAAAKVSAGRPWVYRSDLITAGDALPGQVVRVVDGRNNRLGAAHYSSTSEIVLRMLPQETTVTDVGYYTRQIQRAQDFRERIVADTDSYRVVFADADLMPGLIIDRYGPHIVMQTLTQGTDSVKSDIVEAIQAVLTPESITERNDGVVRTKEGLERISAPIYGEPPTDFVATINGLKFEVSLAAGQKTGLFLDQRENWQSAASHARGKALDCFSYTGGFALHMARHCDTVTAVDSSKPALRQLSSNAKLNDLSNVEARHGQAFDMLKQYTLSRRLFDTIVIDPPAFAKTVKQRREALTAYKEVNLKALKLLKKDGILITCSCSHHVSEADLLDVLAAASLDTGRKLAVVERRTQARDHPILLTAPETHYLKCFVIRAL
jgi:23S rRNA (cytosine1962-C5)-methyltransferase